MRQNHRKSSKIAKTTFENNILESNGCKMVKNTYNLMKFGKVVHYYVNFVKIKKKS